jgi:hypothetical protein
MTALIHKDLCGFRSADFLRFTVYAGGAQIALFQAAIPPRPRGQSDRPPATALSPECRAQCRRPCVASWQVSGEEPVDQGRTGIGHGPGFSPPGMVAPECARGAPSGPRSPARALALLFHRAHRPI